MKTILTVIGARPQFIKAGANQLVGADKNRIIKALNKPPVPEEWINLYGDGHSGEKIIEVLLKNNE